MMKKPLTLLVILCATAVTACAPYHQTYWRRINSDSALYLTGSRATAQLDQDIAFCVHAVDDMAKLDAMREALPPDTAGAAEPTGVLTYYDSPTRMGEEKVSHTDYHDFEGCMRSAGWERQGYMRPQTVLTADNNYQDLQSVRQTGMTVDEKHAADEAVIAKRRENLVPIGGETRFGIEGYRDRYYEPDPDVNDITNYYGINAGYTRRDPGHFFWSLDGRIAHGTDSYNSPSGTVSGVPQYEGEIRLAVGKDFELENDNGWMSPYTGLATRIFRDLGKGTFTDLGAYGYDRRIEQLYLPLGITWRTLLYGRVSMASTVEGDLLLAGRVNSRLINEGGPNVVNTQSVGQGYGLRGDVMFGLPQQAGSIEMGPFFRYWNINDSEPNIQSCQANSCNVLLEPYNTRMQVGVAARVSF